MVRRWPSRVGFELFSERSTRIGNGALSSAGRNLEEMVLAVRRQLRGVAHEFVAVQDEVGRFGVGLHGLIMGPINRPQGIAVGTPQRDGQHHPQPQHSPAIAEMSPVCRRSLFARRFIVGLFGSSWRVGNYGFDAGTLESVGKSAGTGPGIIVGPSSGRWGVDSVLLKLRNGRCDQLGTVFAFRPAWMRARAQVVEGCRYRSAGFDCWSWWARRMEPSWAPRFPSDRGHPGPHRSAQRTAPDFAVWRRSGLLIRPGARLPDLIGGHAGHDECSGVGRRGSHRAWQSESLVDRRKGRHRISR